MWVSVLEFIAFIIGICSSVLMWKTYDYWRTYEDIAGESRVGYIFGRFVWSCIVGLLGWALGFVLIFHDGHPTWNNKKNTGTSNKVSQASEANSKSGSMVEK